jgi:hypothetical protein
MSTLVFVLSTFFVQADEPASLWQRDYAQGQRMAAQENKSVAVFLTRGQDGISKLIPGGLSQQAKQMLASKYVPVMVDTTTPEGQRLARALEMRDGMGLVLSDRGGNLQAFWYQGSLTNQDLIRNLEKFANQTNIRITEVAGRTSLYPPNEAQGNTGSQAKQAEQTGMQPTTTQPQSQRRLGARSNEQRGRLLQGRLFRRSTTS